MHWPAISLFALAGVAVGQEAGIPLPAPDPDIQRMVGDISAERIQRSVFVLASFRTRHTLSDPEPSGDEIGAAGGWVRAAFERAGALSRGRLRVELDEFRQPAQAPLIPRAIRITNIVGILPTARPGASRPVYVMCAHYDSRVKDPLDHHSAAPGADDDASGVAALLEAARAMCPYDFGATLIFLVTAGEEQSLNGSAHWVGQARAGGLPIAGVLNVDTIGNTHGAGSEAGRHGLRLFAQGLPPGTEDRILADGGENDTPARELARAVRDLAQLYTPDMAVRIIYRADRHERQGDQMSFLRGGYAAVRLTEAVEDFRRQDQYVESQDGAPSGDTPNALDNTYIANVCRVATAAFAGLARAPMPPRGCELETERRENDATVRWDANTGPDVAGYRVVWRATTAPAWQHFRDVSQDITRARLPGVCPDDWIFGVEAFDSAGHFSAASYAAPTRR